MTVKIKNQIAAFVEKKERAVVRVLVQAAILAETESSPLTPIDTSNLINSRYRRLELNGAKLAMIMGYSADYAAKVHDPNSGINFRRSSAESEFLTKGVERARTKIDKIIKAELGTK